MKKTLFILSLIFLICPASASSQQEMNKYISTLMKKMTLREKLGQLNLLPGGDVTTGEAMNTELGSLLRNGELGAILNLTGRDKIRAIQQAAVKESRLGIPLLVGLDVIHGYKTIFPIPLAQSCSWDIEGIERGARIAAEECSSDGISWTYSPMVDIALDARWGRIAEGNGEDPYLGSLIAAALVRGYQGDLTGKHDILACLKHYALYGASEAGRDYNTVDMSHLRMFNQYFPPYKAAVEAGVESVMTSFNLVDGQHATANPWLVNEVLRKTWNFKGFVVTDYASINEMTAHGFGDLKTNGVRALKAGTDMDMCSKAFITHCEEALREGLISMKDIDQACRRILEAKYKLGLFTDPYKHCSMADTDQAQHIFTPEHRQAARDFTAETFVLLRNEGNILPLKKQGKIALIGPNANTTDGLLGTWCVTRPERDAYPTLLQAMCGYLKGKAEVLYAQGCNLSDDIRQEEAGMANSPYRTIPTVDPGEAMAEAIVTASKADVIVFAGGEGAEWTGESHSRANIDLPQCQHNLLKALVATGKPVVFLNFSGRPTTMKWEKEKLPVIMNVWFGGTEMGDAICDVLFGDKSPCGRLTTSIPQATGQEPLYYNHLNTGRPVGYNDTKFRQYQSNYFEVSNGPAYPFGYGLSYTKFEYGMMGIKVNGRNVEATVKVTNSGNYDAYEVVQCYIHDIACRYARPVKELKGFQRIFLKKGESKTVTITLDEESLSYYDMEGNRFFEPGEFDIMIGANSHEVQVKRIKIL
ncbi:MAG: beta-glucosidase BglX [Bacteroidaceae bacterium]